MFLMPCMADTHFHPFLSISYPKARGYPFLPIYSHSISNGVPMLLARRWGGEESRAGGASGLHPTLRKRAKDGAPEILRLVKGGPPAGYYTDVAMDQTARPPLYSRLPLNVALVLGLILLAVSAIWLLIGSLWFPGWWYNTIFLGGFSDRYNWRLAIGYLFSEERGFSIALLTLIVLSTILSRYRYKSISLVILKWRSGIAITSLAVILVVCAVLNGTQREGFVISQTIQANLEQSLKNFESVRRTAEHELAGVDEIEPPVAFRYLDATGMSQLFGEIEPLFPEEQREITTASADKESAGAALGSEGVASVKGELSSDRAEKQTSSYKKHDLTSERKAIEVMNYCIDNGKLKYYRGPDNWYLRKALQEAYVAGDAAGAEAAKGYDPSKYTAVPLLPEGESERVQKTAAWSKELETELENLSGLVLVEGSYDPERRNVPVLVSHFYPAPHRVDFVVELPAQVGLEWKSGAKLRIFGVVTRPLGNANEITITPFAIF
jgi:hypothetical protein